MRKPLIHILFWVVFFFMWNRIMYFYVNNNLNSLYFTALDVSLVIIAFYIVYSYVMPVYFKRKNIVFLITSTTVIVVALWLIYSWATTEFLHHALVPIHFDFSWNYLDLQYNRFFVALLGVLAGCFVKLGIDRMEVNRQMEQMAKEKSIAELTYLKAQINPHFLFNSLNSLYAQMEVNSADAKNTLTSLADLLRYQLYDCNADRIPIDKEIAYLKNYVDLQTLRNDNCHTEFHIDEPVGKLSIAPLLLIPFVENAFKYVSDKDDSQNFIKIIVKFDADKLHFSCINSVDTQAKKSDTTDKGIGLVNVKKRLQLIYGNDYQLSAGIDDDQYVVDLTLILK